MIKERNLLYLYDLMGAPATDEADAVDEKRPVEAVKLFVFPQFPLFVLYSVLVFLFEYW